MPVARSVALAVRQDGIQGTVDGVRDTFSGWDSCMAKAYCKWPVIVGIIVGSLIVISVLWCCIRCCCCGMECCCGCLSCCNACCPSPRKKGHKIPNDDGYPTQYPPANPTNYTQYQSQAPPMYRSPVASAPAGPQYAQFDVNNKGAYSKPGNPDALPSMPSWNTAEQKKVEVFDDPSDNVEMNDLDNRPGTPGSQQGMLAGGAAAGGLRPGVGSRSRSRSPYGNGGSPIDERSNSYMSNGSQSDYGAATGGYRGAAPSPQPQGQFGYGTPVQNNSSRTYLPQYGQQQAGYRPYSPASSSANTGGAAYPGQRTYQSSGLNPAPGTSYSGTTAAEPSSAYPDSYRPAQEMHDPDNYVQSRDAGVSRKPVEGSWRDV